jgi:ABC-type transport system substrate-binding protein
MEDTLWPINDMNQLYGFAGQPFPGWGLDAVYQSLLNVNETSMFNTGVPQYLPGLAQNWTISSNGTVYTLNLRQGVNFSNGDQFNAFEVWAEMYTFYYLSANSSGWLVSYNIFNMSSVNFGPATYSLMNQSSLNKPSQQLLGLMENSSWPIYATGPYQIIFHLSGPFVYFPGLLIVFAGTMFDMQYVLQNGGPGTAASVNSYFNTHAIPGTGPYTINGFSESTYISFTQDPNYWGRNLTSKQIQANPFLDPGHVKNSIIYYRADDITRYTDLSTGKAQIAAIGQADWNLVTSQSNKYSYFSVPQFSTLYVPISLNTRVYPTNITLVRQAIVHAINYTDLVAKAFAGQGKELVPPEYPLYTDYYNLGNLTPYAYNLTLAKQDLAAAHITSMPAISYYMPNNWQAGVIMGQVIQSDLAALNITVNINLVQLSDYTSSFGTYSFNLNNSASQGQITVCGGFTWGPSELTPADAWVDFLSNTSTWGNSAIYYNPTVQNAINKFFSSNNVSYVQAGIRQAQQQVYNDAPLVTVQLGLMYGDGSLVWQNGVVKSFLVDPLTTGEDTMPIINTVTLG